MLENLLYLKKRQLINELKEKSEEFLSFFEDSQDKDIKTAKINLKQVIAWWDEKSKSAK